MTMTFRRHPIFTFLLLASLALAQLPAADWYINATTGNDATGNGSQASPYQTVAKAASVARGGDSILLAAGSYGTISFSTTFGVVKDLYASEVLIAPEPNAKVSITKIQVGTINHASGGYNGTFIANLHFKGFEIMDGVSIIGAKNVTVDQCTISRQAPLSGSTASLAKAAIEVIYAYNTRITGCTIENAGVGILFSRSTLAAAINTEIKNITQDGIQIVSSRRIGVSGCSIYNLDDGVSDTDPESKGWGIHPDCIQIFVFGGARETIRASGEIVIKNSRLYGGDGQAIQFNNYNLTAPDIHNSNIVIENNIFGPTSAYSINAGDPTQNLVIRNNSFKRGSYTFSNPSAFVKAGESGPRSITVTNTGVRVSSSDATRGFTNGAELYNNLISQLIEFPEKGYCNYNMVENDTKTSGVPRFSIHEANYNNFVDPGSPTSGELISTAKAINLGTRTQQPSEASWYTHLSSELNLGHPSFLSDINGRQRDSRPDAGAVESSVTASLIQERLLNAISDLKTIFVDDFEDTNLTSDLFLDSTSTCGASWVPMQDSSTPYIVRKGSASQRNVLAPKQVAGRSVYLIDADIQATSIRYAASVSNAYVRDNEGLVFLYDGAKYYYTLDLGSTSGKIFLRQLNGDGTETVTQIASNLSLGIPFQGTKNFIVAASRVGSSLTIKVDLDANGTFELTATTPLPSDFKTAGCGYQGVYRIAGTNVFSYLSFDNIRLQSNVDGSSLTAPASVSVSVKVE